MTGMAHLLVSSLGGFAHTALHGATEARLLGVFDRSIHISVGGVVVCIVEKVLGNGPFNAVLADREGESGPAGWTTLAGRTGDRAQLTDRTLTIGRLVIDIGDADVWQPAPWPPIPTSSRLRRSLATLACIAERDAPADGLARLVLCASNAGDPAIGRVATPRLAAFASWLCDQLAGRTGAPPGACKTIGSGPIPTTLLGLGPGLTPSGDDVLCGALIALDALGRRHVADALGDAALRAAVTATTGLSRSFLLAAASGQGAEALHVLVAALLAGRTEDIERSVGGVARIGHTSGWDALAGVAMVLRATAETAATWPWPPPHSPSLGLLRGLGQSKLG